MDFHCTAYQRAGGVSTYRHVSFSYVSLFGTIEIHILNCPGSVGECGAIVGVVSMEWLLHTLGIFLRVISRSKLI